MQYTHGMEPVEFDLLVAKKYANKVASSNERGVPFSLTLAQFRKLLTRRFCAYTGVPMTIHQGHNNSPKGNNLTIERISNSKGYVVDNVVAVCADANSLKSVLEDPKAGLSVEQAIRMFATLEKMLEKA